MPENWVENKIITKENKSRKFNLLILTRTPAIAAEDFLLCDLRYNFFFNLTGNNGNSIKSGTLGGYVWLWRVRTALKPNLS